MMNNKKMVLPEECKVLTTEEMMQNESGWYVNFKTGEMFITYKDLNTTIDWAFSMMKKLAAAKNGSEDIVPTGSELQTQVEEMDPGQQGGGFGISINSQGFRMFKLNEDQMKLASSNSVVFK